MSTISPNMGLVIPAVGQDYGPQWAQNINASLSILDGHSHVSGSGVPITPSAISMTSDLSFNSQNATVLRSTRYVSQGSALSTSTDVGCVYVVNGNLYFNYNSSTPVQITTGSSVNGSAGTITGLPSGTAGAAFTAISGTFVFTQSTGLGANMDSGTLIVRNPGSYPVPSGNFVAIQAPASFTSAGYSITLPSGVPSVSASPLLMDTAGNVSAGTPQNYFNPTGSMIAFAGSSAPTGWLLCDGSAISRTSYAALFAVVGTAFGSGDGSTTFNLPNMAGNVPVGVGGTIGASLGGTGGATTHTLTIPEMPSHTHVQNAHSHTVSSVTNTNASPVTYFTRGTADNLILGGPTTNSTTATNQNTGGGGAHNNLQPYLALNFIIKT